MDDIFFIVFNYVCVYLLQIILKSDNMIKFILFTLFSSLKQCVIFLQSTMIYST